MDDEQTYWNGPGGSKTFTTPFPTGAFLEALGSATGPVLDFGCGHGRILAELHEAGLSRLLGLDCSAPLLARARQTAPTVPVAMSTHSSLPLPDESVSGVMLLAVLTCMPQDRDQDTLLAEIHRVLRPGGILAVNDFLLNTDQRNQDRYAEGEAEHGTYGVFRLMDGGLCRHFHEERVQRMLSAFHTLEYRPTVFTTMHGNRSNGFFWLGEKTAEGRESPC